MGTESVAIAPSSVAESVEKLFGELPDDVLGSMDVASEKLMQLAALFRSIEDMDEKRVFEMKKLAGLGQKVADDAANFIDCRREDWADNLANAGWRP